ncbi:MAG: cytidine deaminase [Bacteroidetes bacterium]|nr:cytidine deaminase [Bacteroidota bacterium]MBS1633804.1 cytidine deaminase [Bacteroidota bacterium]
MKENKYEFRYEVFDDISGLNEKDSRLLTKARDITINAYAPYSHFHVGAVAILENGEIMAGTNQENASYPVGICAERVLLGSVATLHPDIPIETIAVSYSAENISSDHPISPCGMCRQALLEYETRFHKPIRLILSGQTGKVFVIKSAGLLLPLAFTSEELG